MTKEQHDSLLRSNAELTESNKQGREQCLKLTEEIMTLRAKIDDLEQELMEFRKKDNDNT